MTTETIDTQEVHDAVPMVSTGPSEALIKFDVSAAAVAKMQKQANSLSITGPDDKDGFKAVYDTRQAIKDQRIAVQKKRDALKRPHIDYNREVDAAAAQLIDPMKAIEDKLAHQEKTYNDERERIAREKMLAQQQRTEARVNQIRSWGFQWNAVNEAYESEFVVDDLPGAKLSINFDDIKELSDDDYAPTYNLAQINYENHQAELAKAKAAAKAEADRIAEEQRLENERLAEIGRQQAERELSLQKQADELAALILKNRIAVLVGVGWVEEGRVLNSPSGNEFLKPKSILALTDLQFGNLIEETMAGNKQREADRIAAEAAETERIKAEAQIAKDKAKADKERQKLLKPDVKNLTDFLLTVKVQCKNLPAPLNLPESQDIYDNFFSTFGKLVSDSLKAVDAL